MEDWIRDSGPPDGEIDTSKRKRSYAVVVVGIICTRYQGRVLSYDHSVLVW